MKRFIEGELVKWKNNIGRRPLIIRGARQVGKSYSIEKFGKENFQSIVIVNFELQSELSRCFESLDPETIIAKIELYTLQSIKEGQTLLFFDEIQLCPRALLSLRYFKEKKPDLHVIAAGSLLEFTLHEENFSFPVGRVQFMYMRPLSLQEFLLNMGYEKMIQYLHQITVDTQPDLTLHGRLLEVVRNYMLLGGMPAVLDQFLKTKSYIEAQHLQSGLLESYRNDFAKYATKSQYKHLQMFFDKLPLIVAQHFKYSKIDPETRSRELKVALEQLSWAGLIHRVYATSANGIPLHAELRENKFKLIMLDVGLLQKATKIDPTVILNEEILQINKGSLAEQFVGQELLAYSDPHDNASLYFWEREERPSSAEVDYVLQIRSSIVPIEVKSGSGGRLRSLKRFMEEKGCKLGVTISQAPLEFKDGVLSLPLYMIHELSRLAETFS